MTSEDATENHGVVIPYEVSTDAWTCIETPPVTVTVTVTEFGLAAVAVIAPKVGWEAWASKGETSKRMIIKNVFTILFTILGTKRESLCSSLQ
jgi:hypothetical protein